MGKYMVLWAQVALLMPFGFQPRRRPSKKSAKKSLPLNAVLPPGQLIDVASLTRRNRDLLQAPSVSTIVLPGGTQLAINRPLSDTGPNIADARHPGEDEADEFASPIQQYLLESDNEEGRRKHRNRNRAHRSKAKVTAYWSQDVLPRILPLYVQYQAHRSHADGKGLNEENFSEACDCGSIIMQLRVIVLQWDCK